MDPVSHSSSEDTTSSSKRARPTTVPDTPESSIDSAKLRRAAAAQSVADAKIRDLLLEHAREKKRFYENALHMIRKQEVQHSIERTKAEIECLEARINVLKKGVPDNV